MKIHQGSTVKVLILGRKSFPTDTDHLPSTRARFVVVIFANLIICHPNKAWLLLFIHSNLTAWLGSSSPLTFTAQTSPAFNIVLLPDFIHIQTSLPWRSSSSPLAFILSKFTWFDACDYVIDVVNNQLHNVLARFHQVFVSGLLRWKNPETFQGGLNGNVGDDLRLVADFNLLLVYNLSQRKATKSRKQHGPTLD